MQSATSRVSTSTQRTKAYPFSRLILSFILSCFILLPIHLAEAGTSQSQLPQLAAGLEALKDYLEGEHKSWSKYSHESKDAFVRIVETAPGDFVLSIARPTERVVSFFEWYAMEPIEGGRFRIYADYEGFVPFVYQIPVDVREGALKSPVTNGDTYDFISDIAQKRLGLVANEFQNAHPALSARAMEEERSALSQRWLPIRTAIASAIDTQRKIDQAEFAEIVRNGIPFTWIKNYQSASIRNCELLFRKTN